MIILMEVTLNFMIKEGIYTMEEGRNIIDSGTVCTASDGNNYLILPDIEE